MPLQLALCVKRPIVGLSLLISIAALMVTSMSIPMTGAHAAVGARKINISGLGTSFFPAFQPEITRYGVMTDATTGGTIVVDVTVDDPATQVWINGRQGNPQTIDGLTDGDEVSVVIDDLTGRTAYSFVYLPSGFPRMHATGGGTNVNDRFAMSLIGGARGFEAVVDRHGVPSYVAALPLGQNSTDFKADPIRGGYTVFRPTTAPGRTGYNWVHLDERFVETSVSRTVDLVDTDNHEGLSLPDGGIILAAYEVRGNLLDSVIQDIGPNGSVRFQWSTADHVNPSSDSIFGDIGDYAHLNSIQVMQDGDWLVSFRHLGVYKIARTAHDGFTPGDVVWRLGGPKSSFSFPDDPAPGGPCAQHDARELPNGNILLFDNGWESGPRWGRPRCVNPLEPTGPLVDRPYSRVMEYQLGADVAHLSWSWQNPSRLAMFMGSATRLTNGNTLIGWGGFPGALATEVRPDKSTAWELTNDSDFLSYRIHTVPMQDLIRPIAALNGPDSGTFTQGQAVPVTFSCTDRGGANLVSCKKINVSESGLLDTAQVGVREAKIVATDAKGNSSTATYAYSVQPMAPTATVTATATATATAVVTSTQIATATATETATATATETATATATTTATATETATATQVTTATTTATATETATATQVTTATAHGIATVTAIASSSPTATGPSAPVLDPGFWSSVQAQLGGMAAQGVAIERPKLLINTGRGYAPSGKLVLQPSKRAVARLRIRNQGSTTERFTLFGSGSSAATRVVYWSGGVRRSHWVADAGWQLPALAPGQGATVKVVIQRNSRLSELRRALRFRVIAPSGASAVAKVRLM